MGKSIFDMIDEDIRRDSEIFIEDLKRGIPCGLRIPGSKYYDEEGNECWRYGYDGDNGR